jgi:hypothetical protein
LTIEHGCAAAFQEANSIINGQPMYPNRLLFLIQIGQAWTVRSFLLEQFALPLDVSAKNDWQLLRLFGSGDDRFQVPPFLEGDTVHGVDPKFFV